MTETKKYKRVHICSIIVGWMAMMLFACHASSHMVGAGDTWVALACGRHFINHGVNTIEPFSANSHKAGPTTQEVEKWPKLTQKLVNVVGLETVKKWHPTGWVNQNWLTHVIFYWLSHKSIFADAENFSYNILVWWKFSVYLITTICVYYTTRTLKVHSALCVVCACAAMYIGRTFFDIRPAGFSNLLTAVYLFVLALTCYRNIFYIWLIVPIGIFWCNVHGGYIYLFIMLVPFITMNLLTIPFKQKSVTIGLKGFYHTIAAGTTTLAAVIIFNPFHLTNLTHTFAISISKHASLWRTVNEWHPAFEWNNPVGDEIPFLIMYILAWITIVAWSVILLFRHNITKNNSRKKMKCRDEHQRPKISAALIVIAALTIYMAIRSRRFIPLAAIAACPVIAMFTEQINCLIREIYEINKKSAKSLISHDNKSFITLAAAGLVLSLGIIWGLKFKKVYLDSWPADEKLNSIFMRMTSSHVKPFQACQFIRDNKLQGNMFNYWTEGGFIAYGQTPDTNTGKTPLQLFMDGRAQAAYDTETYKLWAQIISAGPEYQNSKLKNRKINYETMGNWVDKTLKKYNVWLILMPTNQFQNSLIKGIEHKSNWATVFFNNKQKILVDKTTPQGKKIFDGIFNDQTIYPDEFSKNIAKAENFLRYAQTAEDAKKGLIFATKAFNIKPSQVAILELSFALNFKELEPCVIALFKNYAEKFAAQKKLWVQENGYQNKIVAAIFINGYLSQHARRQGNLKQSKFYDSQSSLYATEAKKLLKSKKW